MIQQAHALVCMDKMPAGLKISNKSSHVLHNTHLTAGVDYVQDADEDSAASEGNSDTSSYNESVEIDNSQHINAEDEYDAMNLQTRDNLNTNNLDNHHAELEVQVAELEAEEDAIEANVNILDESTTENEQEVRAEEINTNMRPQRERRHADRLHLCVAHANHKKVQFSPETIKSTNKTIKNRTIKHLKGKRKNMDACDNDLAAALVHAMECCNNMHKTPETKIPLA